MTTNSGPPLSLSLKALLTNDCSCAWKPSPSRTISVPSLKASALLTPRKQKIRRLEPNLTHSFRGPSNKSPPGKPADEALLAACYGIVSTFSGHALSLALSLSLSFSVPCECGELSFRHVVLNSRVVLLKPEDSHGCVVGPVSHHPRGERHCCLQRSTPFWKERTHLQVVMFNSMHRSLPENF